MNRTLFSFFVALLLLSLPVLLLLSLPVLAYIEGPAPELEELPEAIEDYVPDEYQDSEDPAGEGQSELLYAELVQLRANTDYIFWGVIALSGVVLGCFVGITMIRLWGA